MYVSLSTFPNWIKYKYKVKIQLFIHKIINNPEENIKVPLKEDEFDPREESMFLVLNLLHMIIILDDDELIHQILEQNVTKVEDWKKTVELIKPENIVVAEENAWIDQANCYHLAAKYKLPFTG